MQIDTIETSTVVHGIAKDKDKFLLVKEITDVWHIPGGRMEYGESPVEAIIREVKEETGADCIPIGIFKIFHGFLSPGNDKGEQKQINRVHYFFEIELTSAIDNSTNEHTNGAGWFTREEIEQLPIRTPKIFPHLDDFDKCKMSKSVLPMEFVTTIM